MSGSTAFISREISGSWQYVNKALAALTFPAWSEFPDHSPYGPFSIDLSAVHDLLPADDTVLVVSTDFAGSAADHPSVKMHHTGKRPNGPEYVVGTTHLMLARDVELILGGALHAYSPDVLECYVGLLKVNPKVWNNVFGFLSGCSDFCTWETYKYVSLYFLLLNQGSYLLESVPFFYQVQQE